MTNLGSLPLSQLSQLADYLHFEKSKRREITGEVSGALSDILKSKIDPDVIYSGMEGLELLKELPGSIEGTTNTELEHQRDLYAVLLMQLFEQAQKKGITLDLNVPELENEDLTDAANLLSRQILSQPASAAPAAQATPQEHAEAPSASLDSLRARNSVLKAQLAKNRREWPEFIEAQNKLKALNAGIHKIQGSGAPN